MKWGLRELTVCLLLSVAPSGCLAQAVTGIVVDQQQRRVAGAEVDWTCGPDTIVTYTDAAGNFDLVRPKIAKCCLLQVRHAGFQEFRKTIGRDARALSIQLSLAVVRQVVNVSGRLPNADPIDSLPVGSVSISRPQLEKISNNNGDLIQYAKLMAGAPPAPDNVYVDGLPTKALPPAEMISQISVNADPFSAEYADSEKNHIEITTGSPNRKLHFNFGGAGLGLGGGSALAPGLGSSSSWAAPSVSGYFPHIPLTFSAQGSFSSTRSDQLVQAVTPGTSPGPSSASRPEIRGSTDSGSFNLYYSGGQAQHASFSYNQSNIEEWNSGVGGITLPQAGTVTSFGSREVRASGEKTGEHWVWRSGLIFDSARSDILANTGDPNVEVLGYFEAGGAPTSNARTSESNWTVKTVLQSNSQKRYWAWGANFSRTENNSFEIPNPNGQFMFASLGDYVAALSGAAIGTWLVAGGQGSVRHSSVAGGPFLEAEIWHSENSILRGGMRADYQSRGGIAFSPRLSAIRLFHRFIFRAGTGVFVHNWPDSLFVRTMLDDGLHLHEFLSSRTSLLNLPGLAIARGAPVIARISPDLIRPKDILSKVSIQRSVDNFSVGMEYSWTDGTHLLGSRRLAVPGGWIDILESNRNLQKHEVQVQSQYRWGRQNILANYRWIKSRDNTDGPFSFPEFQNNLHAEWGRSTGIPTHNGSLVGNFNLPWGISTTVLGAWHSSSPFTILNGRDVNGDGLFNDRGGRPRNSGAGPGYRSLDLNFHRSLDIARLWRSKSSVHTDCGLHVDNLLGNRNYIALGSVVGSPLFGKPLSAQPGRSLRLWFNFAR